MSNLIYKSVASTNISGIIKHNGQHICWAAITNYREEGFTRLIQDSNKELRSQPLSLSAIHSIPVSAALACGSGLTQCMHCYYTCTLIALQSYAYQWRAQKYLEPVSWSVIMIVISNLVMSIVEREPSGFRITVKQPITTVC